MPVQAGKGEQRALRDRPRASATQRGSLGRRSFAPELALGSAGPDRLLALHSIAPCDVTIHCAQCIHTSSLRHLMT